MPYRDTWVTCERCGKQFVFAVEEQRRLERLGLDPGPPALCMDCQKHAEVAAGLHEGVVKWYDPDRGYGFIIQRSGEEIFFHRTGIAQGEAPSFPDGTRVTYRVEQAGRGPQAVEVGHIDAPRDAQHTTRDR